MSEKKEKCVEKELCDAYREGCQKTLNAKIDAINNKIDNLDSKIDSIGDKVDTLKINEIIHLEKEVMELRKRRLARREWVIIISAFIAGIFSIVVALIK